MYKLINADVVESRDVQRNSVLLLVTRGFIIKTLLKFRLLSAAGRDLSHLLYHNLTNVLLQSNFILGNVCLLSTCLLQSVFFHKWIPKQILNPALCFRSGLCRTARRAAHIRRVWTYRLWAVLTPSCYTASLVYLYMTPKIWLHNSRKLLLG